MIGIYLFVIKILSSGCKKIIGSAPQARGVCGLPSPPKKAMQQPRAYPLWRSRRNRQAARQAPRQQEGARRPQEEQPARVARQPAGNPARQPARQPASQASQENPFSLSWPQEPRSAGTRPPPWSHLPPMLSRRVDTARRTPSRRVRYRTPDY